MMTTQPVLQEQEWSLILDLLEAEGRELPTELRRTDSRDYATELAQRQTMVKALIDRLHAQGIAS